MIVGKTGAESGAEAGEEAAKLFRVSEEGFDVCSSRLEAEGERGLVGVDGADTTTFRSIVVGGVRQHSILGSVEDHTLSFVKRRTT